MCTDFFLNADIQISFHLHTVNSDCISVLRIFGFTLTLQLNGCKPTLEEKQLLKLFITVFFPKSFTSPFLIDKK